MSVVEEIAAERQRQIEKEGWTPDHDKAHDRGELLAAARSYYNEATGGNEYTKTGKPKTWPWEDVWWKPKTPRQDLIRAGALCMAETDRLRCKAERYGEFKGGLIYRTSPEHLLHDIIGEIVRLDRTGDKG